MWTCTVSGANVKRLKTHGMTISHINRAAKSSDKLPPGLLRLHTACCGCICTMNAGFTANGKRISGGPRERERGKIRQESQR